MKNIIVVIFVFLLTFSCTSTEVNEEKEQCKVSKSSFIDLAKQKYGDSYLFEINSTKQYLLCKSDKSSSITMNQGLEYFVYNIKTDSIIYEGKVTNGIVKWLSENELKIIEIPGMIQKNTTGENGYIINVKTNSRTKLNGGVN